MKIEALIEAMSGRLTPSDRKIAEVLLTLGPEAPFLSAHELSRRARTHASTAVRFARKLGYPGYPEFQAALRGAAVAAQGLAARTRSRLGKIGPGDTLKLVIEGEMAALEALAEQVTAERLDALTRRIIAARRIAVFGIGHCAVLADFLALRLGRSGYDARVLHDLGWQAADQLAGFQPGDEIVALVLRQPSDRFDRLTKFAEANGVGLSLVGDLGALAVRPEGALILAVAQPSDSAQSILVPLTIINALILDLSRKDGGKSLKALVSGEKAKKALLRS